MIEYYLFLPDGSLALTCNDTAGHESDIEARSLTAVVGPPLDWDYTYTLVDNVIASTHTPQQAPPDLGE